MRRRSTWRAGGPTTRSTSRSSAASASSRKSTRSSGRSSTSSRGSGCRRFSTRSGSRRSASGGGFSFPSWRSTGRRRATRRSSAFTRWPATGTRPRTSGTTSGTSSTSFAGSRGRPSSRPRRSWTPSSRLSEPGLPAPLVKEALAALGQIKHEKAESALISRVEGLEQLLSKKGDAPFDEAELQPLLERAVDDAGAPRDADRRGASSWSTRSGRRGRSATRRRALPSSPAQDLSDDPELVAFLLQEPARRSCRSRSSASS